MLKVPCRIFDPASGRFPAYSFVDARNAAWKQGVKEAEDHGFIGNGKFAKPEFPWALLLPVLAAMANLGVPEESRAATEELPPTLRGEFRVEAGTLLLWRDWPRTEVWRAVPAQTPLWTEAAYSSLKEKVASLRRIGSLDELVLATNAHYASLPDDWYRPVDITTGQPQAAGQRQWHAYVVVAHSGGHYERPGELRGYRWAVAGGTAGSYGSKNCHRLMSIHISESPLSELDLMTMAAALVLPNPYVWC